MKSNRKGIALLWVVLVSALIFVAILGISMRVVPQKKVENSREYAQRALAVAESGLADIMYKLRTDTALQSTLQILPIGQSYDLGDVAYNSGAAATGQNDSTYHVVIKKTGTTAYTFYSLGTVGPTSTPLARQAITVQYSRNFPIGEYGLLSQTSIHVQGGSIQGNVYAATVTMGNKNGTGTPPTFVEPFAAYVPVQGGSITGVPEGEYHYGTAISVPKLADITNNRFDTYRGYWNDFLNGTGNYNGNHTAEGYPNTSTAPVQAFFLQYLGVASYTGSHPAAYQSAFDSFFTHMQEGDSLGAASLRPFLEFGKMVFDVQPTLHKSTVGFGAPTYKRATPSSLDLQGTIIVEGDADFTGGGEIGVDPSKTAILVAGNVSVSGGQSTLNGLLYIDSTDNKALSIKGAGGLDVTGSIVAQGGIELRSDGLSVHYRQNDVYDTEIKGNLSQFALNAEPSSWRQISYDAFSLMQ